PPFAHVLAPPLVADGRVAGVGAEEGAGAGEAEAALAVLADVPGPRGEHRVRHARQALVRHEDDDLARPGPLAAPPRSHVGQAGTRLTRAWRSPSSRPTLSHEAARAGGANSSRKAMTAATVGMVVCLRVSRKDAKGAKRQGTTGPLCALGVFARGFDRELRR